VAILSPSWAAPGVFPEVHERAMRVLQEELGLIPVEYPTTRLIGAAPEARAADLMSAFADPGIGAVLATIGGDDQLTVLPHLQPDVFVDNPTRYFGYSDNTNFLNYLWRLGIVGYHGGSTMVHLARAGGTHPVSMASLRSALFTNDTVEIRPVTEFSDMTPEWDKLSTLEAPVPTTADPGWVWHNADRVVTAPTWGGNLEILHWNLAAGRWIEPVDSYEGLVLLIETSEEMPSASEVYRMLRNAGERGLLSRFAAVVVGKPKAWNLSNRTDESMRQQYRADQQNAVLRAMATYNADALVVFGLDFGHTDPQYVLPYGGPMTVDGPNRRISVTY
jgi:muramoyltetrapeptide carboxypeptidase LdcA involved in peptidoglycan recycling